MTDKHFLAPLSAPAQRALLGAGIDTIAKLRKAKEGDLLQLHGVGPSSIPVIRQILTAPATGRAKKPTAQVQPSVGNLDKDSKAVQAYIEKLDKKLQHPVQELRAIILNASKLVSEHIKWNSPAFYYNGPMQDFDPKEYKRDLVVMNLHRGRLMLVFPTGAKLDDSHHLLEGDYKDGRRIINFDDPAAIGKSKTGLTALIQQWISLVI